MGGELRVDDVVISTRLAAIVPARLWPCARLRGSEPVIDLLEVASQGAQPVQRRFAPDRLPGIGDQRLRTCFLVAGSGRPEFAETAFDLVGGRVELVAGIGQLAQPPG